jgi:GMP synthase (glutamine-hydrolysing)
MNILCVTHADFETPGTIQHWAADRGHRFTIARPYRGEALPGADSFDILIVMGGPQSPLRLTQFPYLSSEIALIKTVLATDKPVLGFCLGAQLIGEALGATTARSPEKELGVYPIILTAEGRSDPLLASLPPAFPVIHWHNDMPGLTEGATVLATSAGCPRQIVRYKANAYGFQCHLEITLEGIRTMIAAVPEDLRPSTFTQSRDDLLRNDYAAINATMTVLLDRFLTLEV